jgi:vancomycin resistance protein VanW
MFVKLRRLIPLEVRAAYFRLKRTVRNMRGKEKIARMRAADISRHPHVIFSHKARLYRDYPEPWYSLQKNKVHNLAIASRKIDGILIERSAVFSFWSLVGSTGRFRGYKKGMTFVQGRISSSTGGGLCQLSNALYWAALHAGLRITERHRHSLDPFPDSYRNVPFACGATVFYNYRDLRFENNTSGEIVIRVSMDDEYLYIEMRSSQEPEKKFIIEERNHRFEKSGEAVVRKNEIWRITGNADGGSSEELIAANEGLVMYEVERSLVRAL